MGYTHTWQHTGFTKEQWSIVRKQAARIIAASDVPVKLEYDDSRGPILSTSRIQFNGVLGDGYETFHVERERSDGFCKTGRQPYDEIVVAMLGMLADNNPEFGWRSDGDVNDHGDGIDLYNKVFGDV
jgi:hypothetical protein